MKENSMKFSVLVGVPVIALFIMIGMASADPAIHHGIKGVYAVTGFSSCDPAKPGIMEADYTFRIDGTGSISGVGRSLPGSDAPPRALRADFTYTVTKEGRIEFDYPYPPGGLKVDFNNDGEPDVTMDGGPSHGVISPDGKTITISCGHPVPLMVINPDNGVPVAGPVWCVTTLAGMRIR